MNPFTISVEREEVVVTDSQSGVVTRLDPTDAEELWSDLAVALEQTAIASKLRTG